MSNANGVSRKGWFSNLAPLSEAFQAFLFLPSSCSHRNQFNFHRRCLLVCKTHCFATTQSLWPAKVVTESECSRQIVLLVRIDLHRLAWLPIKLGSMLWQWVFSNDLGEFLRDLAFVRGFAHESPGLYIQICPLWLFFNDGTTAVRFLWNFHRGGSLFFELSLYVFWYINIFWYE